MRKHTFGEWMMAVRPWSFPASAMPVIVTAAYIFRKGAEADWLMALWVLVTMILFHSAGNAWSRWSDCRKKSDAGEVIGSKAMTSGIDGASGIKTLAVVLLVAALLSGTGIILCTSVDVLWLALTGAVLAVGYIFLKHSILGDLDILLAFAVIPALITSLAVTGAIDWNVLWAVLPAGLMSCGILHAGSTHVRMSGHRAGIGTAGAGHGVKASAWIYVFEVMCPFVWVAFCSFFAIMPFSTIIIFLTLPVAIACAKTMKNSLSGGPTMIADLDARTANLQLMFSFLLSVAFFV